MARESDAEALMLVLPDDVRLPLIGGEALALGVVVEELDGLSGGDARVVATGGPGQPAQIVREVLATVPHEIVVRGVFASTRERAAADLARRYAAALDPMRQLAPDAPYRPPRLRYVVAGRIYERSVVVIGLHLPRGGDEWNVRRFEITFASYEPWWTEVAVRRVVLGSGINRVQIGGVWPVYPRMTVVAGPGGMSNLTIVALTDGNRQLSFATTYPQGTALSIDTDPQAADIALANGASQQPVMGIGDRRFRLWPFRVNEIELTYSGIVTTAIIEWQERWTTV
jgi:hypothetical protein